MSLRYGISEGSHGPIANPGRRVGSSRRPTGNGRILASMGIFALLGTATVAAQEETPSARYSPLWWPACGTGQVEVMILGTFHFAQAEDVDALAAERQTEISAVIERLTTWAPDRIAVEFPHARDDDLNGWYATYRTTEGASLESPNEIYQLGFRLAKQLDHERVYAVDVPMNLWDDSIQIFDDRWPRSRNRLRRRWSQQYAETDVPSGGESTIGAMLLAANRDEPPSDSELYRRFIPLVEEEVYAGALKLRPWYDRNLRILQNLLRAADSPDDRVLLIIGSGHLRILKQMMEMTPQLCPVGALPTLEGLP